MLGHNFQFRSTPLPPFDFKLTVRKPAGWSLFNAGEILEGDAFWTATRIDGKPTGIKLESEGTVDEPRLTTIVFTESEVPRSERIRISHYLETMIGVHQDLREFYSVARRDNVLKYTIEDLYGMHDTQTSYLFNSVVLSICLQMARLDRSQRMMDSINSHYGDRVQFDGKNMIIEPSAETIALLEPQTFAERCKLGYRAKYIIASAQRIVEGFPTSEEILHMQPQAAKEKLMELPGIGDYAADIINPHGGFPIDAWSVDVFGLLFFGKEPKDRRKTIERVKKEGLRRWGKWAWMGFFYVAQDLEKLSERMGITLRKF